MKRSFEKRVEDAQRNILARLQRADMKNAGSRRFTSGYLLSAASRPETQAWCFVPEASRLLM